MTNKTIALSQFPNIIEKQAQSVTSTASSVISSFNATEFDTAKALISAVRGSDKQVSELLIIHDGVDAYATEYGVVTTNGTLFTINVDVSSNVVRILSEGTSANETLYTTILTLIGTN